MKKNQDWLKIPDEEKLGLVEKICQNYFLDRSQILE